MFNMIYCGVRFRELQGVLARDGKSSYWHGIHGGDWNWEMGCRNIRIIQKLWDFRTSSTGPGCNWFGEIEIPSKRERERERGEGWRRGEHKSDGRFDMTSRTHSRGADQHGANRTPERTPEKAPQQPHTLAWWWWCVLAACDGEFMEFMELLQQSRRPE
jgi:hypothetical protein